MLSVMQSDVRQQQLFVSGFPYPCDAQTEYGSVKFSKRLSTATQATTAHARIMETTWLRFSC
jgi:hypothetical protein